jgi:uncharacterized SAM-binding protein YcdF (DUF218 family)
MPRSPGVAVLNYVRSLLRTLRRIRWRRLILLTVAVWLVLSLGLAVAVHTYGYQDHATPADTLVVLGAGLTRSGNATAAQRYRTQRAAVLWHEGYAPNIICTGGIPWYVDRSEADACKEILMAEGVPEDVIFLENRSRSTQENALYTREIMDANGWTTAVVVSDRYHLLRANWLFHSVGIQAYTSPSSVAYLGPWTYGRNLAREVAALEWQAFANFFNLPFTYVPLF